MSKASSYPTISPPTVGRPAGRPPSEPYDQPREQRPGIADVLLLPPRALHAIFAGVCKVSLGPLRATFGQKIPYSGRKHLVVLPERLERVLGEVTFLKVKAQEKVLPPNHSDSALVERIGRRIVSALPKDSTEARGYSRHLQAYTWEFVAVASDAVNAFVVPGGKVVVYTGLLDMLGRDEDKLAVVLGHEAAHVLARHSAEGVGLRLLLGGVAWAACNVARAFTKSALEISAGEQLAKQIAAVDQQYRPGTTKHALALQEVKQRHAAEVQTMQSGEAEVGRVIDSGINALVRLLVDLPNSRRAETEADKVGLRIAYDAAFNVEKAPAVWDDFARKEGPGSEMMALLSTHPPSLKRKKALQEELTSKPYW